jgi:4-carboxymuconolactone decarboxylase
MSRVPPVEPGKLTPEGKRIHDEIAGPRGGTVAGPFGIWMHAPPIADAANRFGNAVRLNGTLDKRLFEMMVLMIARHWGAQYEWAAHEKAARDAGLADKVIEAIRHRRVPPTLREDERAIYDLITEINQTRSLSEASYDRAITTFGLPLMIEIVTAAGFYTVAAMMINVFDAPVPGGGRPLP